MMKLWSFLKYSHQSHNYADDVDAVLSSSTALQHARTNSWGHSASAVVRSNKAVVGNWNDRGRQQIQARLEEADIM